MFKVSLKCDGGGGVLHEQVISLRRVVAGQRDFALLSLKCSTGVLICRGARVIEPRSSATQHDLNLSRDRRLFLRGSRAICGEMDGSQHSRDLLHARFI